MTPYAEALETQIALSRWIVGPGGTRWWDQYVTKIGTSAVARHRRATAEMSLETGLTFFWAAPMCELLIAAAQTYPDSAMRWDDVPVDRGFMLFERVLPVPRAVDRAGAAIDNNVAAVSWIGAYRDPRRPEVPDTFAVLTGDPAPADNLHAIDLVFWSRLDQSRLVPTAFGPWLMGERISAFAQGPTAPATWLARGRCLMAAFTLLRQQILVARPSGVDRASRRRIERVGAPHEPVVRVVELRRRVSLDRDERGGEPVEWSCRWLVRGHWRAQWCPAAREHRPIWITPHMKGPPDKPLKSPRATVFAVVR